MCRGMRSSLDWKIFGHSDRFYIREYDEETNLRATIVLDASGSMGYEGQGGVNSVDYAPEVGCVAGLPF